MRYTPPFRAPKQKHYSVALSRLMLTTALVGVISIGGTQAFAGDPVSIESENSVTFENSDGIAATNSDQDAIEVISEQNVMATNSGALSSADGMGLWVLATGEADVFNDGTIDAYTEALNVGGLGSANVINEGDLASSSQGREGIAVGSLGDINLENSGAISADQGIFAFSTAGTPGEELSGTGATTSDGGSVNIENSGDITLQNFGSNETISSQGIEFSHSSVGILGVATNGLTLSDFYDVDVFTNPLNTNPDGLNVTITNTGDISDNFSGTNSTGIAAGAVGDVEISNTGEINTGESGIFAIAKGDIDVTNDGDINLSGFSYEGAGISLETLEPAAGEEAGNITVTNNGNIDAPNVEMGLDVVSAGTASVTNTGDITAMDEAIQVEAIGEITITNSGNITGGEYGGEGIQLASDTAGTIVNSGTIIAGDEGIEAWGPGNTTVTNESSGTIQSSIGIEIDSAMNATATNAGTIETDESGITAATYGGSYSETDENGNVETFTASGGEVNVTNSGTISMVQPNSYDDPRYELDGHTLYTPSNVGIFAVSMNGGARVRTEFDENGNPYEERLEITPGADDVANNAVSVTNSGTIDGSDSDQSNGIVAMASDGVEVNNTGDILVAGNAVYVVGNSPVTISNSGTIKVNGEYGLNAVNITSGNYGTGALGQAVTIDNSGIIDLTGAGSHRDAIWTLAMGGPITVANSGSIITTAEGAQAIWARSETSGHCFEENSDNCADTPLTGGETVTINSSGSVSTQGNNADGIAGASNGGAVNLTIAGTVTTTGNDAHALKAGSGNSGSGGDSRANEGGAITVNNTADVRTEGNNSQGLDAWSNGGTVDVINEGKVVTLGDNSKGLNISSGTNRTEDGRVIEPGDKVSISNSGTVSTTGANSNAVHLWTYGGDIQTDLTASSNVSTVGDNSIGLSAYTGNTRTEGGRVPLAGGDIIANLAGTISTGGNFSDGVDFGTSGGEITFNSNTSVTTTGEFSDAIRLNSGSAGIDNGRVAVEGGAITATNLGNLTTAGSEAFGMIVSTSGDIALDNAGDITTSGEDSGGLAGWSGSNRDTDFRTLQDGGAVTIANSGSVTTSGLDSFGIEGWSYGGSVSITTTSESSVSTTGESSYGLLASSGTTRTENGRVVRDGGEVTVNNAGTVTTAGDHAAALIAGTNNASVNVTNSGAITTAGESAGGIFVRSGTDLSEDYPTRVVTPSEDITIVNSGTVTTTGADASGVGVYTTENLTFNNTGVVSASNGLALETLGSTDTVTNSGSLLGGASLDVGADTLTNSGTLTGNFDFGEGDDTLNLNAGSVYSDATFDGGAGTDTATLSGGGTLAGTFSNFESGTLADGSWTLSGTAGSFNTFTTASGSTLALNGGTLSAGQVNLGAESTLSGSGTISGGLTNNGSILLASSDTLQIEGDFHSNANSTLEFSLGGASGTPHSSIEVTDGQFSFDNSDILNIRVDADTNLEGESRYQIVTADGGIDDLSTTNDLEAVEISDSSAAFSFDRTIENNALYITASATITEAVTDLAPQLEDEANAVEEFVVDSGSGGELAEQLNGLDEQELVTAVQELTAPNEAAGAQSIGTTVNTANNVVNSRITSRTSGGRRGFNVGGRTAPNSFSAEAGYTEASKVVMAYGNEGIVGTRWLDDKGYTQVWAQAFWGYTDIDGADSNQYGTSVGIDFRPEDSILIGGSFAYSRSDSDATNSSLTADTYGGMLYGAKSFDGGLSLSGVVGYFHAQNDTRRLAFGSIYSGEYDTNTFTLSGNIAQEIELSSWLFTPNAGVRYAHASFDSYTETGGPAPLTISRSDLNSVELSAQASFSRNFDISATQEGLFEVHLGALYEVADSNTVVSSRFSPTGSVLTSEAGVPRLKFNVGTLVDVPLTDQISAEFAYEGTFASEYADHLLRAKFKLKF